MINLSKLHFLGYSVGILTNEILVRAPHYSDLNKFMVNNVVYNHTSINTFVLIESNNYFFIGTVIKEDMSEHDTRTLINDNKPNTTETPEIFVKILSEINPYTNELIESSQHVPVIHSRVYLANNTLIKQFVKQISQGMHINKKISEIKTTDFASLSQDRNVLVNLSFNALFSKHLGIIGSTGSGKSYTAAKLILSLIKKDQHVVLLDPTGEYKDIVNYIIKRDKKSVLSFTLGKDTKIPYYDLDNNELYKLIHPSSGIQFPKLKDAIKDLKIIRLTNLNKLNKLNKYNSKNKKLYSKCQGFLHSKSFIHLVGKNNKGFDTNVYSLRSYIDSIMSLYGNKGLGYNFYDIPAQLKEECFKISTYRSSKGDIQLDDRTWGYCAPLADRIESNKNILIKYFCNSFNTGESSSRNSSKFHESLDFNSIKNHKLLYINLEHVTLNDYVAEVIGDYIARKLLTSFIKDSDRKTPVVLFLDEAHNFIKKDDVNDDYNLHYFDLMAKEGRKYGLFMTLITQSPYDLSRDVLTQFGTFIIHHLGNGKEREQITSALPYNSNLDKYISSLNTGEAIISSNNLYNPLMVRIHKPSIPPKSNTPKFK